MKDNNYNSRKKTIIGNKTIGITKKKEQVKALKKKCVKCHKGPGTIFTINSTNLEASCGNIENPCNFSIKIQRPIITNIKEHIENVKKNLQDTKVAIIRTKLNLLFNLENEEITTREFETFRDEFVENSDTFDTLTNYLHEKNSIDGVHKNKLLSKTKNVLNEKIFDFKKGITKYKISKKSDKNALLEETIFLYKNDIIPLENKITELKYQEVFVDINSNKDTFKECNLIQNKNTLDHLEYVIKEPEILSFVNKK